MNPELISLAKRLYLSVISHNKLITPVGLDNEAFLLSVLRQEVEAKDKRALAERIKRAALPTFKGFNDFDTNFQKGISKEQLDMLARLEWLDNAFNLVLIGPARYR